MSDSKILQFPGSRSTVQGVLDDLRDEIENPSPGRKVTHVLVAIMREDTSCNVAMTTTPAHIAVYLNFLQRERITALIHDNGMVP